MGSDWQEGPSRGMEVRAHLGTPRALHLLEEGGVCKYIREEQFTIVSSGKAPQNELPKPVARVAG